MVWCPCALELGWEQLQCSSILDSDENYSSGSPAVELLMRITAVLSDEDEHAANDEL